MKLLFNDDKTVLNTFGNTEVEAPAFFPFLFLDILCDTSILLVGNLCRINGKLVSLKMRTFVVKEFFFFYS